ncbi:MAG TPA: DUF5777 family beta-barrel protein [Chitinophagaceae bacterium]|nr:DUF5777 family beta-barrel protein [Chitinophagaceae bacterium]
MQKIFYQHAARATSVLLLACVLHINSLLAQDSTQSPGPAKKASYVKNTFSGSYLIDNQTVNVGVKGTFEFDISHRFGTVNNGTKDLFGIFSSANMRLGFSYVPVKDLQVGFGANNYNMETDFSLKYAIMRQRKDNSVPVSVTYYGNAAMDTRKKNPSLPIVTFSDRLTFFNQLLFARKITEAFSVQAGISLTHINNVGAYYDSAHNIQPQMKNNHIAVCFSGRYKLSPGMAVIVNYDQPLTQHPMNNPHPNISFGLEMSTSGHTFQIFAGNYGYTLPQDNNFLNQNDYTKGQFLIGFNISRLWNF